MSFTDIIDDDIELLIRLKNVERIQFKCTRNSAIKVICQKKTREFPLEWEKKLKNKI